MGFTETGMDFKDQVLKWVWISEAWSEKGDQKITQFIMVIELSGVQFGLKSYTWFQNQTSAQREFDLKSQVWFQTKIARHKVQLPLYYTHFEITEFYCQY